MRLSEATVRAKRARTLVAAFVALLALVGRPLPVAAASYGACLQAFEDHWFTYTEKDSNGGVVTNVRNVTALIKGMSVADQFRPCKWTQGFDGSTGWIAIEPSAGNPQNGNAEAILQIGLIACDEYPASACQNGQKRYFWSEGGCGLALPDALDLGGPVNDAYHTYTIEHSPSSDLWYLSIDGVAKVTFYSHLEDDIKCWATANHTKGQYAFERHDRADGLGDSSHKAGIIAAYLKWGDPALGAAWSVPNFTFCNKAPTSGSGVSNCSFGANSMYAWTTY